MYILWFKAVGASWDEVDVDETGLPPPLALHANIHSLKLDLLSSLFQNLYPTEQDCVLVRTFLSCPASLEEKYSMIRLSDLLRKNKRLVHVLLSRFYHDFIQVLYRFFKNSLYPNLIQVLS